MYYDVEKTRLILREGGAMTAAAPPPLYYRRLFSPTLKSIKLYFLHKSEKCVSRLCHAMSVWKISRKSILDYIFCISHIKLHHIRLQHLRTSAASRQEELTTGKNKK